MCPVLDASTMRAAPEYQPFAVGPTSTVTPSIANRWYTTPTPARTPTSRLARARATTAARVGAAAASARTTRAAQQTTATNATAVCAQRSTVIVRTRLSPARTKTATTTNGRPAAATIATAYLRVIPSPR